ncbi:MAG: hypothetical protein MI757_20210 [Pirellulales bacterium]|nr:hypothetical protein [Pirellulales bacterium]
MFVRWSFVFAIGLSCLFVSTDDAEARRRYRYYTTYTGSHLEYVPTKYSTEKRFYNGTMSLQDIAYMRAQWMAHNESLDHGIHYYTTAPPWPAEVSEGIGCGNFENATDCATCVTGSTVVADASCRSKSGVLYRVRFFR